MDVDPALVHHYFGTKDDLFVAALALSAAPANATTRMLVSVTFGAASSRPGELPDTLLSTQTRRCLTQRTRPRGNGGDRTHVAAAL